MTTVKGIDVSVWQGNVDFAKVKKAGYDFVIIRAGYGRYASQKDKCFEANYKNAKAAGLNVGAYWYSYATTAAQAEEEAKVFAQVISGKQFEYPLVYDIEDSCQAKLSVKTVNDMCKAFCGYLEKQGYYVSVYSYGYFLRDKINDTTKKNYDTWLAEYTTANKPSVYTGAYGIWQYSSTGKVNGISGNVDLNISYKDYPSIMKSNGLNGFKMEATNVTTVEKPKTEPAKPKTEQPTTTETKPAKEEWVTYTVKKGDTLWKIATQYKTTVIELAKINSIKNANIILVGQVLKIKKK